MDVDHGHHDVGEWPAHRRPGLWAALLAVLLFIAGAVIVLGLTDRVIPAPQWVVAKIQTRANAVLKGEGRATVGGLELYVDDRFVPHVRMTDVELFARTGRRIARLPSVESTLDGRAILTARLQPKTLRISGAEVALSRNVDGTLDFTLGDEPAEAPKELTAIDPVAAVDAFDRAFTLPVLRDIDTIEISDLSISYRDLRAGKNWKADGSWLQMNQTAESVTVNVAVSVSEGGSTPARAAVSLISAKGSPAATLSADVRDISARDLAAQSPALAWLGALDAPISGAIWSSVDETGRIQPMNATLKIGKGALRPTETTKPVRFDGVALGLTYDPGTQAIQFREIQVDGAALKVRATAKAWLKDITGGVPNVLVGQVAIGELKADPEGLFETPVTLSQGAVDMKVTLEPFALRLGQLVLMDGERRIAARGEFRAAPKGWEAAFDATIDSIESDRLLALWPVAVVPKTREWLRQNVATSELFNVTAGLRAAPDAEPRFSLGYEYRATDVRVLRTLPPVQDGAGYASIIDNTYTLVVDRGHVIAPNGGRIDVSGSVMQIPDLRIVPAPAEITLRTKSPIAAALSLLDQPPFRFLSKAGQKTDLADGDAEMETKLKLKLAKLVRAGEVGYEVSGVLTGVRSDRIVPGKLITAERLNVSADPKGISIGGPGAYDGIPVDVIWRQDFGHEARGKSTVSGTVELSPKALDAFAIRLPNGAVAGRGRAKLDLKLEKGAPTRFELKSDLAGLTLAIPEIGWTKGAGTEGELFVSGALGTPAVINRLKLSAAGLRVDGKIALKPYGGLEAATFPEARLDDWFDGEVILRGRGKGENVAVEIAGGSADLRKADFGGGKGGGETPVTVALDELRISSGIALNRFRGAFGTAGGFSGRFAARLNGEVDVTGTVEPAGGRSAFRIRSDDAGSALRAAGLYRQGNGGTLALRLDPAERPGTYQGRMTVKDFRVTDAPALAALLDAVSVVGLLTQLNGQGIFFANASGDFYLTPDAVEIRRASAIGPSMGISAAGVYQFGSDRIAIDGTISPIYVLNGIGQIFSKRREGLFGFNYKLTGTSAAPQIGVNPLSILTPGVFRDLFRADPPTLPQ